MEHIGLEVRLQEVGKNRPNVIGILRGSGGGRSLMLNGHMDTVGVAGMAQPFVGRFEDGKVYGRGAFDMKGAISSLLLAAKAVKESGIPLKGDLILTTVVDEEFASTGTGGDRQRVQRRRCSCSRINRSEDWSELTRDLPGLMWKHLGKRRMEASPTLELMQLSAWGSFLRD